MCGLAGFIGFKNNIELAHKANKIQQHRGPTISLSGTTTLLPWRTNGFPSLICQTQPTSHLSSITWC
jgi:hypothetical protein